MEGSRLIAQLMRCDNVFSCDKPFSFFLYVSLLNVKADSPSAADSNDVFRRWAPALGDNIRENSYKNTRDVTTDICPRDEDLAQTQVSRYLHLRNSVLRNDTLRDTAAMRVAARNDQLF